MKKRYCMILRSSILIILFYCSVIFQYIPFILFHEVPSHYTGNTTLAILLYTLSNLFLFAIILWMYRKDIREELSLYFKKIKYNLDTGFACWFVGLLIMITSNVFLNVVLHSEGANNEIAVRSMIHSLPILMFFNVCFFAPFIEEFVFRKALKDVFSKPILFILISFLVFGVSHVYGMANTWIDWLYIIPYGALGGTFAFAYYKTDSIFTSMTFHIVHNLCVFLLVLMI